MKAIEKRLEAIERQVGGRQPVEIPEWLAWVTDRELDELETIFRIAAAANATELDERSCHRVWAIYSTAMARKLDAPPEVRADLAARDAHVRASEDRDRPRWYP